MIKRLMIMLVAWMSAFSLHATNVVSVGKASGDVGGKVDIIVSMDNDSPDIAAAEIQIPLPDGVIPVNGSLSKNESRLPNHSVTGDVKNGKYVIVIYNTSLSSIPSGSGEICRFKVDLGENPGNFDLTPIVKLSDKAGKTISSESDGGILTVLGAKLEINGQQLVDFGKVPIRSKHIKEFPIRNIGTTLLEIFGFNSAVECLSASFSPNQLEVGESGTMTLEYAPKVRSKEVQGRIYVKSNSAGNEPYLVINSQPLSVNELHIENAEGISDEEVNVCVKVNNMEPLVGVEFTLNLSKELEYVEGSIAKSSRSDAMTVEANCDASRKLRIVLFNASNKSLLGEDGEILTFRLKLMGNTGRYTLTPEKVILSNREGENMTSKVYSGYVSITSPQLSCSSEFQLGNVPLSGDSIFEFPVSNYGSASLKIEKVSFLQEGYSCKCDFPIVIESGGQGVIPIIVNNPVFGDFRTTMNIYSNDPSNRLKAVSVSGNFYSSNELSFLGSVKDNKFILNTGLVNEAEIVAMQMDFIVPDGVTTSESELALSDRAGSHSFTLADIGKNKYRLIIFSLKNTPFSGKSGDVFSLGFDGEGIEGKEIKVENIKLSSVNGIDYASPDSKVQIELIPITVKSIDLSEKSVELYVGASKTLNAIVLPENATDKTLDWSSSDETVAIVDANGKVTAKTLGEATITATCGSVKATCKVTVVPTPVESVTLSNTSLSLTEGETATLTATVAPADATDKSVTWTSSDISVATVSASGEVTAVKAGTATMTASSSNGKTATCTVTVAAKIIDATGITLSKTSAELKVGESVTLTAAVLPEDATHKSVTWSSSNEAVASVDANGKVTAQEIGEATITVSCGSVKATCKVTVVPTPVESVTLSNSSLSLTEGETATLTATVFPSDATDKSVTWISSDTSVATVSASGEVTAVKAGTATITASSSNGKTASCTVTVAANIIPVTAISISRTSLDMTEGDTAILTASVLPENATDKSVTWTSSDVSVAIVSASGEVTAVKAGTATMTASSSNGKTATCTVTVTSKIPEVIPVTGITLSETEWIATVGEKTTLTAKIHPEDASDKNVVWTSDNEDIAKVDNEGNVMALAIGDAIITATCGGFSAKCTVSVVPILAESLTITPEDWSGEVGDSFQIVATILPDNTTNRVVKYASSNGTIAAVDINGFVTLKKDGNCYITVSTTDGSKLTAQCNINVISGVELLFSEPSDKEFDVYTQTGVLLKSKCTFENIKKLQPAIYIIRCGNSMKKVCITN